MNQANGAFCERLPAEINSFRVTPGARCRYFGRHKLREARLTVSMRMLRMHGGALYIYHEGCPFAHSGMVHFDFPRFRSTSRDVEIKANHVRRVHVSGVSICRNATVLDLRLAATVVAPVLEGCPADSGVHGKYCAKIETVAAFLRCSYRCREDRCIVECC